MQVARDKLGASTGSGVSSLYTVQSLCTSCYVHCTLVAAVWSWAVVWAHLFLRLSPQLQASCRKSEENRSMRGKASNKAGCGKGVIARIFFQAAHAIHALHALMSFTSSTLLARGVTFRVACGFIKFSSNTSTACHGPPST